MATIRYKLKWSDSEIETLQSEYPWIGLRATAKLLGRSVRGVAKKAWKLRLRIDPDGDHFYDFQSRAAASKVGKKRPAQSLVMKRNHELGKLKKTQEQLAAMGKRVKAQWEKNGHPRGNLGHRHTPEAKAKMSAASHRRHEEMTPEEVRAIIMKAAKTRVARGTKINPHGNWKQEWRTVGGREVFFRSSWEANYARYLEWMKKNGFVLEWEHEPETFWFDKVKRGCVSYLPDFRVTMPNGSIEYHEVKGYMDDRSKVKLKRMKKYYPRIKMVLINAKFYRSLANKISKAIPGWE